MSNYPGSNSSMIYDKLNAMYTLTCGLVYVVYLQHAASPHETEYKYDARSITLQSKVKKDIRLSLVQFDEDTFFMNVHFTKELFINKVFSYNKYLSELPLPIDALNILPKPGCASHPYQRRAQMLEEDLRHYVNNYLAKFEIKDDAWDANPLRALYYPMREFLGYVLIPQFYKDSAYKLQLTIRSNGQEYDDNFSSSDDGTDDETKKEKDFKTNGMAYSKTGKSDTREPKAHSEVSVPLNYPEVPFGGRSLDFKGIGGNPFGKWLS